MMLQGKTAIITGGGTGIGEGIARRFVAEGAKVCITGRREDVLNRVVESLPEGSAVSCRSDVSEPGDIERIVEAALSLDGKINVLVNNAGVGTDGSVT